MKKIVILGSSAAGVKIIEEVRREDASCAITIIAFDGHYPYKRDAFAPFMAKEISPEEVFYRSKDFYEKNNVNVVLDKKISRINFKRKKIFTEDKEQIDYDVLIVTDTPENRFPDIKGTNKENVFGFKKLKDIDQIVNALPVVKTVAIQSDSFSGLQMALSLVKREKEVILVSSEDNFLSKHFEPEVTEWLMAQFEEKGLRVMSSNAISELLGDKEAKAIRLQSGKVIAAEIVVFGETSEDLRLFAGSEIQMDRKIAVDSKFKANVDDVFVVDQTCSRVDAEPVTPLEILEEQGKSVAAVINGQERSYCAPLRSWHSEIEGIVITILGQTETREGVIVYRTFDAGSGQYQGLYVERDNLIGAVLVNAEDQKEGFARQITEKVAFQPVVEVPHIAEGSNGTGPYTEEAGGETISTELIDN